MKARITIQKLKKSYKGKSLYRVTKLVNSKRINLLDSDYEEDELKQLLNSFPATYEYQILQG
ncbi:uncharacterized protein METZ01_LOCUS123791 [marine metagenome]|uniref:Uncharacterized protein n=1 Tax=marine metagenome TaxID=408172 RepID=A0A381Y3F6_9ZZZZ